MFAKVPTFDETDLSDANVINFFNQTVDAKKWFGEDNFKEIVKIVKNHDKFLRNKYIDHVVYDMRVGEIDTLIGLSLVKAPPNLQMASLLLK